MGDHLDSIVRRPSPPFGGPSSDIDNGSSMVGSIGGGSSSVGVGGGGGGPAPSSSVGSPSSTSPSSWRVAGQRKRADMLREDEESGGSTFYMNRRVSISKYYEVAHRALLQFRDACQLSSATPEETYLMGNRLVKFITAVLPTHPEYASHHPDLVELRGEVKAKLLEAGELLSDVSIQIDRVEYRNGCLPSDLGGQGGDGGGGPRGLLASCGGSGDGSGSFGSDPSDPPVSLLNTSASSNSSVDEQHHQHQQLGLGPGGSAVSAAQSDFAAWGDVDFDGPQGAVAVNKNGGWADFASWPEEAATTAATAATTHSGFTAATATTPPQGTRTNPPPVPSILLATSRSPRSRSPRSSSPKDKGESLRVSFADDVKPGKHGEHDDEADDTGDGSDSDHDHDDVEDDDLLNVSNNSSLLLEEELEMEHQTFLRATQIEFSGGDGGGGGSGSGDGASAGASGSGGDGTIPAVDDKDGDGNGNGNGEGDDGNKKDGDSDGCEQVSGLSDAFARVLKYDTDEVDDVPTDESDSENDDEFANAPQNDVSGSTDGDSNASVDVFLKDYLSDGDDNDGDGVPDEDDDDGLSFVQKVALENIMKDKSEFEEEDSDAEDSWAQEDGDGDGDDDGGDFDSDLGFDGPLPTFPTDGRDPFFADRNSPWPDDVYAFGSDLVAGTTASADGGGGGGGVGGGTTTPTKNSSTPTKDVESVSGTDETAPSTSQSSYELFDYYGSPTKATNGDADELVLRDGESVPDRLNYLESKLRALQDRDHLHGRCSSPTTLREDEVEL